MLRESALLLGKSSHHRAGKHRVNLDERKGFYIGISAEIGSIRYQRRTNRQPGVRSLSITVSAQGWGYRRGKRCTREHRECLDAVIT